MNQGCLAPESILLPAKLTLVLPSIEAVLERGYQELSDPGWATASLDFSILERKTGLLE